MSDSSSSPLPERLWTSAQVAEYLQLTEESIRRLARQSKIMGYKTGDGPRTDWRFDPASVRDFLKSRQENK